MNSPGSSVNTSTRQHPTTSMVSQAIINNNNNDCVIIEMTGAQGTVSVVIHTYIFIFWTFKFGKMIFFSYRHIFPAFPIANWFFIITYFFSPITFSSICISMFFFQFFFCCQFRWWWWCSEWKISDICTMRVQLPVIQLEFVFGTHAQHEPNSCRKFKFFGRNSFHGSSNRWI